MENFTLKEIRHEEIDGNKDFYAIYESENYTCTLSYDGDYENDKQNGIMEIPSISIIMEAKNPYKNLSPMWFPLESLEERCTSIQQPALAVRADITEEIIDEFYRVYKLKFGSKIGSSPVMARVWAVSSV